MNGYVVYSAGQDFPLFIHKSLRMIYDDSSTTVEYAGKTRRTVPSGRRRKARDALASGFLLTRAFDSINSVLTRCGPTAPSFPIPMRAMAPAFRTVDGVTGMNLSCKTCYWIPCGCEACDSLYR